MNLKICDLINKLKNYKITPNQFGLLYLLDKEEDIDEYCKTHKINFRVIKELIRREFVKFNEKTDKITITVLGTKLVSAIESKPEEIEIIKNVNIKENTNIDEPVALKKFKEAGLEWMYYWRENYMQHREGVGGSITDCIVKMKKFLKNNPDVTPEIINKATQAYINSLDNLKYMRRANYFIYKQYDGSLLEEWVEIVTNASAPTDWSVNSIN